MNIINGLNNLIFKLKDKIMSDIQVLYGSYKFVCTENKKFHVVGVEIYQLGEYPMSSMKREMYISKRTISNSIFKNVTLGKLIKLLEEVIKHKEYRENEKGKESKKEVSFTKSVKGI